MILKQDQLFICEREVKEPGHADEVLDLMEYERCEEVRKNKSRSKKNHSKFRLLHCTAPGVKVPNVVFLAVSPEEKESWINVLSVALTRAKNRILDEVTAEDGQLSHLTRDRVKIPHNRRLPTRGHLLAVASASSDVALTLDLIQEDDLCPRSRTDTVLSTRRGSAAEASGKSHTLPRQAAQSGKSAASSEKSVSLEHIHKSHRREEMEERPSHCGESDSVKRLQELIEAKLQQTERLLTELNQNLDQDQDEAHRLLTEARYQWTQAHQVLTQVQQLKDLYQQLDSNGTVSRLS